MKFIHLADLHLGKRLNEYDLTDCQKKALDDVIEIVKNNDISTVVISGDIYDSHDPSVSATNLLDNFLSSLNTLHKNVLMISGNHDQADKLHFGSTIFKNNGIHIITDVKDSLNPIKIDDVNFYLLPFVNKYDVKKAFSNTDNINNLSDAVKFVIDKMNINKNEKNVLLAHQAVIGSKDDKIYASGSEVSLTINPDGSIGGEDIISSTIFKDFNYVALGHIHKAMNIETNMRYPGALLKYHKDESNYKKTFTIVDTNDFKVTEMELKPLRDVILLKGLFDEVKTHVEYKNDFVFFDLDDSDYVIEPMAKLKQIFPYAVNISYNSKSLGTTFIEEDRKIEDISKLDLFKELYKSKMDKDLDKEEEKIVKDIVKEMWGEDNETN